MSSSISCNLLFPSRPLSSLGSRPHLNSQTTEPLNPCLHSFTLTSSIPRPCKALTEKKGQTFSNTSQGTSSRNPDMMEVDALCQGNQNSNEKKTHKSYLATMKGRCFGCGLKEHNKKDGNHERDVCHHCAKAGHRSTVCLSKYLGKLPAAKAAATETSTSGPNSNGPSTSSKAAATTTTTQAKYSKMQADLLAQLLKCVEDQDKELKAIRASF